MASQTIVKVGICVATFAAAALLGLVLEHNSAHDAPQALAVHMEMSSILQQEAPRDVQELDFELVAGQQSCYMRNAGREAATVVGQTPHGTVIRASFHRLPGQAERWVSDSTDDVFWVRAYNRGEAQTYDQEGLSATDFRTIVRDCVSAVREAVRQGESRAPSIEQRRQSWEPGKFAETSKNFSAF